VYPTHAERALAPVSLSSCGIDSIVNPHLNDDPGTIIGFPGETFELESGVELGFVENPGDPCKASFDVNGYSFNKK